MSATSSPVQAQESAVGKLLRTWRAARGMSQLDLALVAGFSARHISFIETGRAQPSREALVALSEALDIPLRERNRLFEAAGYAPAYRQTPLGAEEMTHLRGVLQFILDRHQPYAAVVLDRHANFLMGNDAATKLVATLVEPDLLTPPVNFLRITFHPRGARRWIVNWDDVSRHLLERAERELTTADRDSGAAALLTELRGYVRAPHHDVHAATESADLLLPIHFRKGDAELRLFSTIMTLGTPRDVTLQELRVETFFPADDASAHRWREIIASE